MKKRILYLILSFVSIIAMFIPAVKVMGFKVLLMKNFGSFLLYDGHYFEFALSVLFGIIAAVFMVLVKHSKY